MTLGVIINSICFHDDVVKKERKNPFCSSSWIQPQWCLSTGSVCPVDTTYRCGSLVAGWVWPTFHHHGLMWAISLLQLQQLQLSRYYFSFFTDFSLIWHHFGTTDFSLVLQHSEEDARSRDIAQFLAIIVPKYLHTLASVLVGIMWVRVVVEGVVSVRVQCGNLYCVSKNCVWMWWHVQ